MPSSFPQLSMSPSSWGLLPMAAAVGAGVAVLALLSRSLSAKKRRRHKILVSNPAHNHVYLFVFPGTGKCLSYSPFCNKLAIWLRIAGVKHTTKACFEVGPTGKSPFVEFNGQKLGDSSHIIDLLSSTLAVDLDSHLTPEQKALSLAVQRMMEEHSLFIEAYYRWQTDDGYAQIRDRYFKHLPVPMRWILPTLMIRPMVVRTIKGQGIGRMNDEIIYQRARKDVDAISTLLGDKMYLMGEKPCNADATVFGVLSIICMGVSTPFIELIREKSNLVDYVKRMEATYLQDTT